jgi:hypothetical protein
MKYLFILLMASCNIIFAQEVIYIDFEGSLSNTYKEIEPGLIEIKAKRKEDAKYKISLQFSKNELKPIVFDTVSNKTEKDNKSLPQKIDSLLFSKRFLRGDKLIITVTKVGDADFKKEFVFEVMPLGKWKSSFGITSVFNNEKDIYLNTTDNITYIISEKKKASNITLIPTLFYHFTPYQAEEKKFHTSFTAGIGLKTNNATPSFFLGGSVIYYQNLSIQAGVALHQIKTLLAKYDINMTLKQNLSVDELTQKSYTINPFVSMSLRLDKNPFK